MADTCLGDVQLGSTPVIDVTHATQIALNSIEDRDFNVPYTGVSHLARVHGEVKRSQLSNSVVYDTQVIGRAMEFQVPDSIMDHLQGIHVIESAKR